MGSRAVVLVCREGGAPPFGGTGAVYTRTGRSFFTDPELTAELLARVRRAVDAAGLWDELRTGWLLLDCELLPWSAKAEQLIREQYASVGAAAGAALPAARSTLAAAVARGLDGLAPLADRLAVRATNAERFTETYRRYVWPTDGLAGVRLAPFAVLASDGASHVRRDRDWHLSRCDRLVAAEPELLARTERVAVDLEEPEQVDAATGWWLSRTAAGAEGMVVKPYQPGEGARTQPGVKCRGREYLRLIYGPDYTVPDQLTRLRGRSLGHKRRLALREHALGLAALDRLAAREPMWRVHELVFAILAAQAEPVDPRL